MQTKRIRLFVCKQCGVEFYRARTNAKFCSSKCSVGFQWGDPLRRFWMNVVKSDGCWEWAGYVQPDGYGRHSVGSRGNQKATPAHRFMYELVNGSIDDRLFVCHKCDNRRCVRPDHLFVGTPKDNTHDAMRKGRLCRGEEQPKHKLSEDAVRQIRLLRATGRSSVSIGKDFGVSHRTVLYVCNRTTWKHVV